MEVDDSNGSYTDCDDDAAACDEFLTFSNENTNKKWSDLNGANPKEPMSKQTTSEKVWRVCCVPSCGRSYGTWPQIRLFKFPRNAGTCKLWLSACNIDIENFDLNRSFICDSHFHPDQLRHPIRIQQIVPSLNLPHQIEQRKLLPNSPGADLPYPVRLVKIHDEKTDKEASNKKDQETLEINRKRNSRRCCVPNCGRSYATCTNIRMYSFPLDVERRRAWLEACGLSPDKCLSSTYGVCDDHFLPHERLRRIHRDILPTQNLPKPLDHEDEIFPDTAEEPSEHEDSVASSGRNPKRNSRRCCVPTCGRSYATCTDIRMYSLPIEVERRRTWLEACGLSPDKFISLSSTYGVCDAHFRPHELLRRLHRDTVPTQNLPDRPRDGIYPVLTKDSRRCSRKCCVPNCGRSYRTNKNIRIFMFPRDVKSRRAWLKACAIPPDDCSAITMSRGVCDAHFKPRELLQRLPRGTVPTQNLPEPLDNQDAVFPDIVEEPSEREDSVPDIVEIPFKAHISPKCCIASCGRIRKYGSGSVRIYAFPQDEQTRRAWFEACGLSQADYNATNQTAGVCDAHFLPDELSGGKLAAGIVPTQKLPAPEDRLVRNKFDFLRAADEGLIPDKRRSSRKCCVPNCGRSYRTSKNVRLCKFPDDKRMRRLWAKACGLSLDEYYSLNARSRVCDAHFLPHEVLSRLRHNAVPTQNLPGGLPAANQDDALDASESEAEDCDFCLYSERRIEVYRHRYERITAKLAALKRKETEAMEQLKILKPEMEFQQQPDLRRPENREKIKDILRNVPGLSKSAQVMFRMLMKPIQSWEEDEKQLSLNLYYKAPIAFRFFAQKLKLHVPSRKTIIRWAELDASPVGPKEPKKRKKRSPNKKSRPDAKGNTQVSEVDPATPQSTREDELVAEIPETDSAGFEDPEVSDLIYEDCEDLDCEEIVNESPEDDDQLYEDYEILLEELNEDVHYDSDMEMCEEIEYLCDSE